MKISICTICMAEERKISLGMIASRFSNGLKINFCAEHSGSTRSLTVSAALDLITKADLQLRSLEHAELEAWKSEKAARRTERTKKTAIGNLGRAG